MKEYKGSPALGDAGLLASAQAVVLFLMAVAVAVVQFRWLQTDVEY